MIWIPAMRRTARIRRVDVWSLFKVAFVLYAILGLIAGLFYGFVFAILGQIGGLLEEEGIPGLGFLSGALGVLAAPVLAVLYGVFGSVVVAIGGVFYNLAARWVGGVGLDLEIGDDPSAMPPSQPVS
jgi:hypothetical protein